MHGGYDTYINPILVWHEKGIDYWSDFSPTTDFKRVPLNKNYQCLPASPLLHHWSLPPPKKKHLTWWQCGFKDNWIIYIIYMNVSENSGSSPQIIHFNRVFHYFHHPFWGTSIFGNTEIDIYISSIDLCSLARSHGKAKLPMQGHASLDLDFGQVDSRRMRLVGPPTKKKQHTF